MEISIKRSYGYYLIIKADNVNIEEDIEERIYPLKEDGKTDFSKPPARDVSEGYVSMMANALDDMIYYREKEYDSSSLIKNLFDKLPRDIAMNLAVKLNKEYSAD